MSVGAHLREARPKQWAKNVLVFVPMLLPAAKVANEEMNIPGSTWAKT